MAMGAVFPTASANLLTRNCALLIRWTVSATELDIRNIVVPSFDFRSFSTHRQRKAILDGEPDAGSHFFRDQMSGHWREHVAAGA